jgi:hypothetical protein
VHAAKQRHDATPPDREAAMIERAPRLTFRRERLAPIELALRERGRGIGIGNRFPPRRIAKALIHVTWSAESGARLGLVANLSAVPVMTTMPAGEAIYASAGMPAPGTAGVVPRYGVSFVVEDHDER